MAASAGCTFEQRSVTEASKRAPWLNSSPMFGARKPSDQLARKTRLSVGPQFSPSLLTVSLENRSESEKRTAALKFSMFAPGASFRIGTMTSP